MAYLAANGTFYTTVPTVTTSSTIHCERGLNVYYQTNTMEPPRYYTSRSNLYTTNRYSGTCKSIDNRVVTVDIGIDHDDDYASMTYGAEGQVSAYQGRNVFTITKTFTRTIPMRVTTSKIVFDDKYHDVFGNIPSEHHLCFRTGTGKDDIIRYNLVSNSNVISSNGIRVNIDKTRYGIGFVETSTGVINKVTRASITSTTKTTCRATSRIFSSTSYYSYTGTGASYSYSTSTFIPFLDHRDAWNNNPVNSSWFFGYTGTPYTSKPNHVSAAAEKLFSKYRYGFSTVGDIYTQHTSQAVFTTLLTTSYASTEYNVSSTTGSYTNSTYTSCKTYYPIAYTVSALASIYFLSTRTVTNSKTSSRITRYYSSNTRQTYSVSVTYSANSGFPENLYTTKRTTSYSQYVHSESATYLPENPNEVHASVSSLYTSSSGTFRTTSFEAWRSNQVLSYSTMGIYSSGFYDMGMSSGNKIFTASCTTSMQSFTTNCYYETGSDYYSFPPSLVTSSTSGFDFGYCYGDNTSIQNRYSMSSSIMTSNTQNGYTGSVYTSFGISSSIISTSRCPYYSYTMMVMVDDPIITMNRTHQVTMKQRADFRGYSIYGDLPFNMTTMSYDLYPVSTTEVGTRSTSFNTHSYVCKAEISNTSSSFGIATVISSKTYTSSNGFEFVQGANNMAVSYTESEGLRTLHRESNAYRIWDCDYAVNGMTVTLHHTSSLGGPNQKITFETMPRIYSAAMACLSYTADNVYQYVSGLGINLKSHSIGERVHVTGSVSTISHHGTTSARSYYTNVTGSISDTKEYTLSRVMNSAVLSVNSTKNTSYTYTQSSSGIRTSYNGYTGYFTFNSLSQKISTSRTTSTTCNTNSFKTNIIYACNSNMTNVTDEQAYTTKTISSAISKKYYGTTINRTAAFEVTVYPGVCSLTYNQSMVTINHASGTNGILLNMRPLTSFTTSTHKYETYTYTVDGDNGCATYIYPDNVTGGIHNMYTNYSSYLISDISITKSATATSSGMTSRKYLRHSSLNFHLYQHDGNMSSVSSYATSGRTTSSEYVGTASLHVVFSGTRCTSMYTIGSWMQTTSSCQTCRTSWKNVVISSKSFPWYGGIVFNNGISSTGSYSSSIVYTSTTKTRPYSAGSSSSRTEQGTSLTESSTCWNVTSSTTYNRFTRETYHDTIYEYTNMTTTVFEQQVSYYRKYVSSYTNSGTYETLSCTSRYTTFTACDSLSYWPGIFQNRNGMNVATSSTSIHYGRNFGKYTTNSVSYMSMIPTNTKFGVGYFTFYAGTIGLGTYTTSSTCESGYNCASGFIYTSTNYHSVEDWVDVYDDRMDLHYNRQLARCDIAYYSGYEVRVSQKNPSSNATKYTISTNDLKSFTNKNGYISDTDGLVVSYRDATLTKSHMRIQASVITMSNNYTYDVCNKCTPVKWERSPDAEENGFEQIGEVWYPTKNTTAKGLPGNVRENAYLEVTVDNDVFYDFYAYNNDDDSCWIYIWVDGEREINIAQNNYIRSSGQIRYQIFLSKGKHTMKIQMHRGYYDYSVYKTAHYVRLPEITGIVDVLKEREGD